MKEDKCTSCNGTGEQVFHGQFNSIIGVCNFCKGTGDGREQTKWFLKIL